MAPSYLTELLVSYTPESCLCSASQHYLYVDMSNSKFGDRSFGTAACKLWNDLPCEVKLASSVLDFKKRLKTHLFKQAY